MSYWECVVGLLLREGRYSPAITTYAAVSIPFIERIMATMAMALAMI